MLRTGFAVLIAMIFSIAVFAQNPITADNAFQIHYAANLNLNDSVFDITNSGATNANICVNVYAIDPAEELIACCTCTVTPDSLVYMSVNNDILTNTGTGEKPTSRVIKLIATTTGGSCDASQASSGSLATGLEAWMTTTHAITTVTTKPPAYPGQKPTTTTTVTPLLTETPFIPSTLSAGELNHLATTCSFIETNDSGSGICAGCHVGGK